MYKQLRQIYNEHMKERTGLPKSIGLNPMQSMFLEDYHGKLLDIGCGNGSVVITLLRDYKIDSAVALDISDVCIDYAKQGMQLWDVEFDCIRCAFEEYDSDCKFDIITLWEGLEHYTDIDVVLLKVVNLLCATGLFIGSVPDLHTCDHEVHLHHFNASGLESILRQYFKNADVTRMDLTGKGEFHLVFRASGGQT